MLLKREEILNFGVMTTYGPKFDAAFYFRLLEFGQRKEIAI
jgi:hypothetical protein